MPLRLSRLYVHPVKSLAGIRVSSARMLRRGLEWDREWMVVQPDGTFLTQRNEPRMALIETRLHSDRLELRTPGAEPCPVPFEREERGRLSVRVWNDDLEAERVAPRIDAWLSEVLGREVHLVRFPDDGWRSAGSAAASGDRVAFADAYPCLLLSEASLEALNARLSNPVAMRRFRPNLVVEGCEPHAEDEWKRVRIGEIRIRVVKPCARCRITTVDPETARTGPEPLKTLATYRKGETGIEFGQNVIPEGEGRLEEGDPVSLSD